MKKNLVNLMLLAFAPLVLAQQPEAAGNEAIKKAALNPNGFTVDWVCTGQSGRSYVLFRDAGDKIVADVNNYARGKCTTDKVKITDSGVTWDGCNDPGITLSYRPDNQDAPFQGRSGRCSYEFKARH